MAATNEPGTLAPDNPADKDKYRLSNVTQNKASPENKRFTKGSLKNPPAGRSTKKS